MLSSISETTRSCKEPSMESREVVNNWNYMFRQKSLDRVQWMRRSIVAATLHMFKLTQKIWCMESLLIPTSLAISYGQMTISLYHIFHLQNNSCIPNGLWPPRTLVTLHWFAAIFLIIWTFLNLCYHHSIVYKHLLNLTNCFALRITKLLTKFDAMSLLNSFSHRERNKKSNEQI